MESYDELEKYEAYAASYDPNDDYGRNRKPRPAHRKKKQPDEARAELTDVSDDVADFVPTYAASLDPQHHERQWVIESIAPFYRDNQITDVARRVKAGKEANVYCCMANPATGVDLIAAKLYRPRMLRTLKNDADYKAGRQLRGEDGKELRGRRERLAVSQKTNFGKHLDMVWWIGNEFNVQRRLLAAGADVPLAIAHGGNAILMEYIGDEQLPAPTLSDVTVGRHEAQQLFDRIIDNIALMLELGLVHGDLSAYNILYWNGEIRIIDFPQVVETAKNPNARRFLERDISRICGYFGRLGVKGHPMQISQELWRTIVGSDDVTG